MRSAFRLALICGALASGAARADGADIAYSSTSKGKGCRIVLQPPPGNQDEHHPTIMHCGGTAGFGVRINYLGTSVHITIAKGDLAKAPVTLGAPYDVGPAIEWRGVRAANGFRPDTAIIRLQALTDKQKTASVLAVLRVDGDKVCPAAYLDATITPNANEEARVVADRIAGRFRCGTDKPILVGKKTELVEEVASRSGVSFD